MKLLVFLILFVMSSIVHAGTCKESIMPTLNSEVAGKNVQEYITALNGTILFADEDTKGSYCHLKNWYEERMTSWRFSARMLAVLIIVLGASLPLIVILDQTFRNQKFWIAFIGASIVIGQGFSQTFQYEESWRNYTVAKLELESTHRAWQKQVIDASFEANGLEQAKNATDQFSHSVSKIVLKETTGFFDSLSESVKNLTSSPNEQ